METLLQNNVIIVELGPGQAVASDAYSVAAVDDGLNVTNTAEDVHSTHHISPHHIERQGVPGVAPAEISFGTNGNTIIYTATETPGINVMLG